MEILRFNDFNNHNMKESLNLSARALSDSIEKTRINYAELAKDYSKNELSVIEINKDTLLNEFYDILYKNVLDESRFGSIKNRLILKMLVYYDKFYVADANDNWSIPYYFTTTIGNELIYFNTKNNTAAYYDSSGTIKYNRDISFYSITPVQKNDIIINKINTIVMQYTSEKVVRENGLRIEIKNPANPDNDYRVKKSYFNALNGITFFVVYVENTSIAVNNRDIKYKNYNVVGYTIE